MSRSCCSRAGRCWSAPSAEPTSWVRTTPSRTRARCSARSTTCCCRTTTSLSPPADASLAPGLGWVVDPDQPIVLLLDDPREWDDAIRQSLRIGHESVVGYLRGGFPAWIEAGQPVESNGRLTVDELAGRLRAGNGPVLLDVRQTTEFVDGHVPGAMHLFAGDLQDRLAGL